MSLFPRSGSSAGTAAGMSHLYPPRIACFVCGAEGPADYPLFPEPPPNTNTSSASKAHFPFLLVHPPPLGCSPIKPGDGRGTKSCRPCHMTLMRRWDEYESARVPGTKRVYFVKRVDGLGLISQESQMQAAMEVQMRAQAAAANPAATVVMAAPKVSGGSAYHLPPGTTMAQILPVSSKENRPSVVSVLAKPAAPPPLSSEEGQTAAAAGNVDNDSALDLSSGTRERENLKSRSSVTSHVSAVSHQSGGGGNYQQSEGTNSSTTTDISDLTLPDKNATFEVCYVCGDEFRRGTLSHTFAKQMNREPFYPSLMIHPRPPRSRPMDAAGRVQTCDDCHNHLLDQWTKFETEDLPHADRNYALRKRASSASLIDTTFVCYLCSLDYHSSSLRLLYSRPNSEREPYYPFIEQQKPPPGASPISPQGMVQVCNLCFKSTKEKHHGFVGADQPPPKKRRVNSYTAPPTGEGSAPVPALAAPAGFVQDDDDRVATMPADVTCILCRRKFSVGSFKFLHTCGPPHGGLPYFPFLTELPRPDDLAEFGEEDKQGRVRACQTCATSLMNQWTHFQRENVNVDIRNYTYPSLSTGPRSVSSVRAHSPVSQKSAEASQQQQQQTRTRSNTLESRPRSSSNPHSPNPKAAVTSAQPPPPLCHSPAFSAHSAVSGTTEDKTVATAATAKANGPAQQTTTSSSTSSSSFYCFLCGLHSELSFSRMLYSTAPGKRAPHFPFMKSHVPKNKAETLREDGTALVCTFCYHSVMVQWSRYNDGNKVVEHSQRKYNLHDYSCYVCGVTTYRKRIRALRVLVSKSILSQGL
jgi:hypothetical protein